MAATTSRSRRKPAEAGAPVEKLAGETRPRPTALTPDVLRELCRPFTVEAIRFKPQTVTKDKSKAMATFYIDARLAAARLNHVVGPEGWADAYRVLVDGGLMPAHHFPVECALSVLGVTKVDVGVYQKAAPDSMAWKSAYSDALKRAAVKFGVGAYLYGMPKVWAPVDVYGEGERAKVKGFSQAGEKQLRGAYTAALQKVVALYGDPLDHGDVGDDPDTAEPVEPEPKPPAAAARETKGDGPEMVVDKEEITRLVALAEAAGIARAEALKLCAAEKDAHGGYRRVWVTEQLQFLNGLIEQKAGKAA